MPATRSIRPCTELCNFDTNGATSHIDFDLSCLRIVKIYRTPKIHKKDEIFTCIGSV